jgi:hypothetical protein
MIISKSGQVTSNRPADRQTYRSVTLFTPYKNSDNDEPAGRPGDRAAGRPLGWVYTNLFVSVYIYLLSTEPDQTIS